MTEGRIVKPKRENNEMKEMEMSYSSWSTSWTYAVNVYNGHVGRGCLKEENYADFST